MPLARNEWTRPLALRAIAALLRPDDALHIRIEFAPRVELALRHALRGDGPRTNGVFAT
jgi:hypothetical protein